MRVEKREFARSNLIGWRQTLTTSPANHIRVLLVRANKFTKWKTGFRGYLYDPALPGCNEAWDRFDVLKIAITCGTCLSKVNSEYFKVI